MTAEFRIIALFYKTSKSIGYKITLSSLVEFQNTSFKVDFKNALNILFSKIEDVDQKLSIILEQTTIDFSKKAFEEYAIAKKNLKPNMKGK